MHHHHHYLAATHIALAACYLAVLALACVWMIHFARS
jgi:hypothetical protein